MCCPRILIHPLPRALGEGAGMDLPPLASIIHFLNPKNCMKLNSGFGVPVEMANMKQGVTPSAADLETCFNPSFPTFIYPYHFRTIQCQWYTMEGLVRYFPHPYFSLQFAGRHGGCSGYMVDHKYIPVGTITYATMPCRAVPYHDTMPAPHPRK